MKLPPASTKRSSIRCDSSAGVLPPMSIVAEADAADVERAERGGLHAFARVASAVHDALASASTAAPTRAPIPPTRRPPRALARLLARARHPASSTAAPRSA